MLIGLSGLARSGKDTAAEALVAAGWERRAFADVLRNFVWELDPYVTVIGTKPIRLQEIVRNYGWDSAKVHLPEVRRLLQRCGTEAGRGLLGEDVWINATIDDLPDSTKNVVVTDVRYPNEADAIKQRLGIVVRIERPGVEVLTDSAGVAHVSETSMADYPFDHYIVNSGTVEDLHYSIRLLARTLPRVA